MFKNTGTPTIRLFETFLVRLGIERPRFSDDVDAAIAIARLVCRYEESDVEKILDVIRATFDQLGLSAAVKAGLLKQQLNPALLRHVMYSESLAILLRELTSNRPQ